MEKKTIKVNDYDLEIQVSNYCANDRLYIGLNDLDGFPYADVTINLTDASIPDDDFVFINGDLLNSTRKVLEDEKIISKTLLQMPYNMEVYDLVQVNFDKLKEYDLEGVNAFLNGNDEFIKVDEFDSDIADIGRKI